MFSVYHTYVKGLKKPLACRVSTDDSAIAEELARHYTKVGCEDVRIEGEGDGTN